MSLMILLRRLTQEGSQFLIATHSPILMAFPGARIYELSDTEIRQTAYRETEHYRLTKRFLNDPESMLRELFEDSDETN